MTDDERTVFQELQLGVARIETAIVGNGTKGLAERMSDGEEWHERHEDAHRAYIEDQHAYRIKREEKEAAAVQKELDGDKKKHIRQWAFVGSVGLVIVGQLVLGLI